MYNTFEGIKFFKDYIQYLSLCRQSLKIKWNYKITFLGGASKSLS